MKSHFSEDTSMIIRAITHQKQKNKHIYRVYLWNNQCLTVSSDKDGMQGQSNWDSVFGYNDLDFESGYVDGAKMVNWYQVPSVVRSHIEYCIESGK